MLLEVHIILGFTSFQSPLESNQA